MINNIKFGDYLHSDGTINDIASSEIIGICVIPSNILPDGLSRFISLRQSRSIWGRNINLDGKRKKLPGRNSEELDWEFLNYLDPPYLQDGSFNPNFLKDLPHHDNVFQDYKGYKNTRLYREKYGDSENLVNAFSSCFRISPSYRKFDWYLPSICELALLYEKIILINEKISLAIKAGSLGDFLFDDSYWSSSEWDSKHIWYIDMHNSYVGQGSKDYGGYVCPFLTL